LVSINITVEKKELRSANWFGRTGKDGFIYRAWMKNQGIPDYEFNGKPISEVRETYKMPLIAFRFR